MSVNFHCGLSLPDHSRPHLWALLVLVPAAAGQTPRHLAGGGAGGEAVRLPLVDLVVTPDPNSVEWQVHVHKLAILGHDFRLKVDLFFSEIS